MDGCVHVKFNIMPKYKVKFKEAYMPLPVERVCNVQSESEVIRIYDLKSADIEWYEIEEIKG